MLRSGTSTQHSILRQLRSGTSVEVLEVDAASGYSRVRTEQGTEGWVLSRYLLRAPTARQRLPELEARVAAADRSRAELQESLRALEQVRRTLEAEVDALRRENAALQSQLERVSALSANALQLDSLNTELKSELLAGEQTIEQLSNENRVLAARSSREWFIAGAGVLLAGLLLGLILPRIRWRRRSSWGELR